MLNVINYYRNVNQNHKDKKKKKTTKTYYFTLTRIT